VSGDVLALVLGTILGVGAIAFVLYPLFFEVRPRVARATESEAAGESAVRALREIEFDRATGKLSEADYAQLRRRYGELALAELRAGGPAVTPVDDPIEARVRAYRSTHPECPNCGVRPEADARFCSSCGSPTRAG